MSEVIYPKLSYQRALTIKLKERHLKFQEQLKTDLIFNQEIIGRYFVDFLIDNKIALELKVGNHFLTKDIQQLFSYLKASNLKLGIIVNFTAVGIKYKRIVNIK